MFYGVSCVCLSAGTLWHQKTIGILEIKHKTINNSNLIAVCTALEYVFENPSYLIVSYSFGLIDTLINFILLFLFYSKFKALLKLQTNVNTSNINQQRPQLSLNVNDNSSTNSNTSHRLHPKFIKFTKNDVGTIGIQDPYLYAKLLTKTTVLASKTYILIFVLAVCVFFCLNTVL